MISHWKRLLGNMAAAVGDLAAKNFGQTGGELREDRHRRGLIHYRLAKSRFLLAYSAANAFQYEQASARGRSPLVKRANIVGVRLLPRQTTLHRLPRGVALPRPPPDGFPVVLGQLPPEEPLPDRPPLPPDLAPLDEPFDEPPELPRAPLWLPPVPLLIVASVEHRECY